MKRNRHGGFTLLEILFGLAITAVVLVILLAALRMGQRSQEKGLQRAEFAQRMRATSDRLSWLLEGAYPYRYTDPEDKEKEYVLFRGGASSVEFVTTSTDEYSGGPEDRAGLKFVRIFADSEGLKASEMVFFMGAAESPEEEGTFVFGPRVMSAAFEYMDVDPESGESVWLESWDNTEKDYIPAAVRVSMSIMHGEEAKDIPPVVARLRTGGGRGLVVPLEFRTGYAYKER
jgi:prepilin-type N-terminal cleavage/methylation domain-containing protein